ncbi:MULTISPECIES: DUF2474 family protein [unclassified Iodidimonas]|jgi:hypothetical protein|nr:MULTISPECIES: DUF2474 family protein [unclassified Iodidimonas]
MRKGLGKLIWFGGIWLASVLALGVVAYLIRWLLH